MTTEPTNLKRRRRRWLQFSLRTFLVLLTITCLWIGWQVQEARVQREAVAAIRELGGSVWYDYAYDVNGYLDMDADPPSPQWLRDLVGPDFFNAVVAVDLSNTQVSDVTPLAKLTSLERLDLSNTQVSDVTPLARLSLKGLGLPNTISAMQVENLRKALPNCEISWSPSPTNFR